ncbi:MAG: YjfB family protein [Clostridium sp.]|uniref:YjfB family protein n=1 Tax=Clostridium sp. TaxID=1506 RepID=UPI0025B8DAEA|nr:YjfB family protein [Clostridium sp.]MCE5220761.1 YjfB family protein [Clostridium sp.]
MDIAAMSVGMHQASLQSAVSISVMKLAMNNGIETATQITDMMSNMAVDTSRGNNIDARA